MKRAADPILDSWQVWEMLTSHMPALKELRVSKFALVVDDPRNIPTLTLEIYLTDSPEGPLLLDEAGNPKIQRKRFRLVPLEEYPEE